MAPLFILLFSFLLLHAMNRVFMNASYPVDSIGRVAMAIMLVFTAVGHFAKTDLMVDMMPDFVPFKTTLVYLTGVFEAIGAVMLCVKRFSRQGSWLLIIFLMAVLPANIVGSLKEVALGGMEYGTAYLYFRIPLQLFFIWWIYYFGIRRNFR
jgi:uncharacterized membrane protein